MAFTDAQLNRSRPESACQIPLPRRESYFPSPHNWRDEVCTSSCPIASATGRRTRVRCWAYMVMAVLAWNLKAWFGLLAPDAAVGQQIVRMEFKRFWCSFILIPCQIVRTGRRLLYRILTYTRHLKPFLETFDFIRACRFA